MRLPRATSRRFTSSNPPPRRWERPWLSWPNLFDPAAIVLGGGLGSAAGLYHDRLIESARRQIWHGPVRWLPIVSAELGTASGLVGAALRGAEGLVR